jgi:hypothetical protein
MDERRGASACRLASHSMGASRPKGNERADRERKQRAEGSDKGMTLDRTRYHEVISLQMSYLKHGCMLH